MSWATRRARPATLIAPVLLLATVAAGLAVGIAVSLAQDGPARTAPADNGPGGTPSVGARSAVVREGTPDEGPLSAYQVDADGTVFLQFRPDAPTLAALMGENPLRNYASRTSENYVLLRSLPPDHPFRVAGLTNGDRLLSINGSAFGRLGERSLREWVAKHPRPARMALTYERAGTRRQLTVYCLYVPKPPEHVTHVVEPGETLDDLAQRYFGTGLRAYDLVRANDLKLGRALTPGRELLIPTLPGFRFEATETAPGVWLIPRHERDAVLANFPRLLAALRPVEHLDEGAPRGVRFTNPDTSLLPYRRGLAPGDLITHVNGIPLITARAVLSVFDSERDRRFLELRLRRGDQELRRVYALFPSKEISEDALLTRPVFSDPRRFGCTPLGAGSAGGTAGWRLTRAFTRYLAHHYRELLDDVQAVPAWDPKAKRYVGVRLKYVEPGTLWERLGFSRGDVVETIALNDGPAVRVTAPFVALRRLVDAGPGVRSATFSVRQPGAAAARTWRLEFVDNPPDLDVKELPLPARFAGPAATSDAGADAGLPTRHALWLDVATGKLYRARENAPKEATLIELRLPALWALPLLPIERLVKRRDALYARHRALVDAILREPKDEKLPAELKRLIAESAEVEREIQALREPKKAPDPPPQAANIHATARSVAEAYCAALRNNDLAALLACVPKDRQENLRMKKQAQMAIMPIKRVTLGDARKLAGDKEVRFSITIVYDLQGQQVTTSTAITAKRLKGGWYVTP